MGLLRTKDGVRLYTGVHDSECSGNVDLTKKYIVCAKEKHLCTDSWKEADQKYAEWSGEAILTINKT